VQNALNTAAEDADAAQAAADDVEVLAAMQFAIDIVIPNLEAGGHGTASRGR